MSSIRELFNEKLFERGPKRGGKLESQNRKRCSPVFILGLEMKEISWKKGVWRGRGGGRGEEKRGRHASIEQRKWIWEIEIQDQILYQIRSERRSGLRNLTWGERNKKERRIITSLGLIEIDWSFSLYSMWERIGKKKFFVIMK